MNAQRWFAWRRWSWLPAPVRRWQDQYQQDAIYHMLAPSVLDGQAAGITETWATPATTAVDVLAWIPEQFAPSPESRARAADWVKILIAHCTEAEHQRSEDGSPLQLPADALIITWLGARSTWYWDGHDAVAQALPIEHSGLYIAVNAIGAAIATAPMVGRAQGSG